MEQVNVIGVRADGSSEIVGTAPMPPKMKMRQIVREYFGEPDLDPNACDEAATCLWALEAYHEWLVTQGWQPPPMTLTPNAIGQGSAACGASPAPTGCASNGNHEERTEK